MAEDILRLELEYEIYETEYIVQPAGEFSSEPKERDNMHSERVVPAFLTRRVIGEPLKYIFQTSMETEIPFVG